MRVVITLVAIALLAGGGLWLYNTDPSVKNELARADVPGVDTGIEPSSGSTTVTVPTDIDVSRAEGEMPDVQVTTEEKTIEYPTLKTTEDGTMADDTQIEPVNEEPNDPVPSANSTLDDDNDGNIDFNDADENTDSDSTEDDTP